MTKATAEKLAETQEKILLEIKEIKENLSRLNSLKRLKAISSDVNEDEGVWETIEPTARKVREEVFRQTYPDLYAKAES